MAISALVFQALLLIVGVGVGAAQEDSAAVLITLDADSVSVNTVLQILAERSGLNIVTGPEVRGQKISLHLRNTPFEEALDLTVRAGGFGYQRVGSSILVGSADRLEKETGVATHVVTLQYADAVEVKKMLETLTKSVEIDIQGNRLVATGPPSVVEEIKRILRQVDVPPQTVLIQSRVIEVSSSALEELGVQWDKITKWTGVITEGDQGPSPDGELPAEIKSTKFDDYQSWFRQQAAFQVAVDLLITDGSARVIAESKIVTTNNRKADIFIGEDIPVVITSLSSAGGFGTQQIQLEHIKVGVSLTVTPRISEDDFITMLVEPKVSNILEFIGPDNDLPHTSERTATTYVRSENGKTIFVGGLQAEDTKQTIIKVPLLGDIPVLGNLFRHYRNETQKKDLLIEITPTIVR